ncbi:hypothetical protein ISG33_11090 [Glaciecola sp. MH2013]|uniref:RHS repeat-associated core domain-containing protein n=1 Tax=Glaciecola sp. MH2013 TaxID=2785524 RepID=UPI00189E4157|nr:RHS repeat-associated core domain-containing protein [Glaciecola sp. MH2013]MBF7073944.1 hypothetical protein [Glaciecola sp. MH2013]
MLSETDGVNTKTYSYDGNQRMIGFNDGTQSITYEYNPDGIRTSKSVDGITTDFIVDSNRDYAQVIAEQVNNTDIQKEYVFGYDLLSQSSLTDIGDETQTNTAFYHYDSLGTTRNLSNTDASISDSYFYEAFGELLASDGDTDNDYLYTGEQYDAQLDNYYLRARYYNQGVGRFTQMDEWMGVDNEPVTLNKYIYAYSDGINIIDPSGMFGLSDIMEARTTQNILRNINVIGRGPSGVGANATGRKLIWNGGCFIVEEIAEDYISNAIGLYVFEDIKLNKPYVGQSKVDVPKRVKTHFRGPRATIKNLTHILPVSIADNVEDKLDDVLDALEQSFIDDMDGPGGKAKGPNSEGNSANKRNQFKAKKREDLGKLMKKFKICD